ncbi:MAG: hypothetical protein ACLQT7_05520 [Candidatus Dormibacteria bacterium]
MSHHGIWQSSDLRLYDANAGRRIRDPTVKQFRLVFDDGGVALVTYTGVGRIGSKHVSDWVLDMLRGERRNFDQSLAAIVALANDRLLPELRSFPPRYRLHAFTVGAFSGGPIYAEVNNADVAQAGGAAGLVSKPLPDFRLAWRRPAEGEGIASPAGAAFMAPGDVELLARVCARRPGRDADFLRLLAAMTRRAAGRFPEMVSPECWALHAAPTRDPQHAPEEPTPFAWGTPMPSTSKPRTLTMGIDFEVALTAMTDLMGRYPGGRPPAPEFQEAAMRGLARAMSYEPGLRVRHLSTGVTGRVISDRGPGPWPEEVEVAWDTDPGRPVVVARADVIATP